MFLETSRYLIDISYKLYQVKVKNDYIDPHIHVFPFQMIYVIRNPRDVLVSGYFFFHKTNLIKNPESLMNYFEWFLKGNGECPIKYRSC